MSQARLLYQIFYEGCTAYAEGYVNGEGKVAYTAIEEIPTLDLIQEHIDGTYILGAYTVSPGNYVRWMAFDIDSKKLGLAKAREMAEKLCKFLGATRYILEYSGNKGYHVILIFREKVLAKDAKEWGEKVRDFLGFPKNGDPHVEVYPKQSELKETEDGKLQLGNLLRLPCGVHPGTQNQTMFIECGKWDDPLDPEQELTEKRVTLEELNTLLITEDPKDKVMRILLPYWTEGQRHDMSLCTSGYLATLGWTEEDVMDLITLIHDHGGEGDLKGQLNNVKTTFKRIYNGESVLGFQGLSAILSSKSLADLLDWAGRQTSTTVMQLIDRFRLEKGAIFQKVRKSEQTILTHLKENGKLVINRDNVYWLDSKTKKLVLLAGEGWKQFAHKEFGINSSESFGKQVLEGVKHSAADTATPVDVHRLSHWNKDCLYINVGGPEVVVIDGGKKSLRIIYNGDEDVLFLNDMGSLRLSNILEDDESSAINPWDYLVNDISFKIGSEVQATPEQQREMLKAYIISIFFPEIMATRPILTILAATGSGKCLAKGTKVLMYSGQVKSVENIVVGDFLMGPDSLPRQVRSLARGRDEMRKIIPVKGDSFTVNKPHILSLIDSGRNKGKIVNISVEEYEKLPKTRKHTLKLYRSGVDFEDRDVKLDPYILGTWLGDGHSDRFAITTPDLELVSAYEEFALLNGYTLNRNDQNGTRCPTYHLVRNTNQLLRDLGVLDNKHVPNEYKINSREVRSEVLAGLLDTDGYYSGGGYEIAQKRDDLADDILFLARSLGLAAYKAVKFVKGKPYNRIYISGDCSFLPLRIERKKALPRKQIKSVLKTGFSVENVGMGEYFGFEITGDGLFMLGDFTVTHNTTVMRRILKLLEGPDEEVLGAVPDKPDSFRSSLVAHRFLALDNLEKTNASWLPDMLNRVSTGTHIETRKLWTDNDMHKIRPNCYIALTATEMPFSDETVYTRMLPIELEQLTAYRSEVQIQAYLVDNISGLWKGLIEILNEVVAELKSHKEVEMPSQTRLADFAVFCARIKGAASLNGEELIHGLENLVSRQKKVLEENSPLVDVINIWAGARRDGDTEYYTVAQLFTFWQRVSNVNKIDWRFRSAQGLAKHMEMLLPQLIEHYGMSTRMFREGGREIRKYKFERAQTKVH